ncbi:allose kinase [Bifidobacterium sp. ESL0732]|uniref:allose kinase n=1 Tax=Bifidobacterium sp. ESL0732 TaxID=2983222 RepID=UPI0023FA3C36|nr:allose kinase [Bifidobacterium sp. ESL0732]WEV64728.1 allose kinase [Bifidobacterium sp. ESL0732]
MNEAEAVAKYWRAMPMGKTPDGETPVVLGIDCGGTHLRVGLIDSSGEILSVEVVDTQKTLDGKDAIKPLASFLSGFLDRNLSQSYRLSAISAGFPSLIDQNRRKIIQTTFIEGLQNVDVVKGLSQFKVPVFIDRDVNFLLKYDSVRFELPKCGAWVGCYIGTGLGCALAFDGKIMVGKHGVAGELGHVPGGTGIRCGCGNMGCLESKTAGHALVEMLKEHYGEDEPIGEVFVRHGDEPFVDEWLEYLARAFATAINLLDPQCVLVGGGIPQMKGFPKQKLEEKIRVMARKPVPASDLELTYTTVAPMDGVLGGAMVAFEQLALDGQ